jgi:hypothetical protein
MFASGSASPQTLILNIIFVETSALGAGIVRLRQNEDFCRVSPFYEV